MNTKLMSTLLALFLVLPSLASAGVQSLSGSSLDVVGSGEEAVVEATLPMPMVTSADRVLRALLVLPVDLPEGAVVELWLDDGGEGDPWDDEEQYPLTWVGSSAGSDQARFDVTELVQSAISSESGAPSIIVRLAEHQDTSTLPSLSSSSIQVVYNLQ